jgi:hypothetical protein
MNALNRRFDQRIPFETYLTTYINDRPMRAFTTDISETGLHINTLPQHPLPPRTPVGIELALPGMPDTLWLGAELRFDDLCDDFFQGRGIRFTAMADKHGYMLRWFCYRARRKPGSRVYA